MSKVKKKVPGKLGIRMANAWVFGQYRNGKLILEDVSFTNVDITTKKFTYL